MRPGFDSDNSGQIQVLHVSNNSSSCDIISAAAAADAESEKSLLLHNYLTGSESDSSCRTLGTRRRKSKRRQIFAAFAANLGGFALGTVLSWTSPALPSLRADNATFPDSSHLTTDHESWISSIVPLGAALGGPVAGSLTDLVGRRTCMCIITFPFIVGWISIYLAQAVPIIIFGRFMTGVCAGGFSLVTPIFVGEISDAEIRGYLASGFELMVCVGILFINVLGAYTPWRIQALASAVVPVLIFFLLLFVPESPRYLLRKGWSEQAAKALAWFKGADTSLDDQVQIELAALEDDLVNNCNDFSFQELIQPRTLRPFSIALCLVVLNEMSAIDVVTFYTVDLFASAGVSVDAYQSTIAVGVVQIIAAIAAAIIVDKYGRRFLLLLSQGSVGLSLGTFTLFYILKQMTPEFTLAYLAYLPLVSLIIFSFTYVIGLGTVIYLIMGEILPQSTKGFTSGTITVCKWILGFMITKLFVLMRGWMGDASVFGLFTGASVLGFWYMALCVPETNGKTLEEIQSLFGDHVSTTQPPPPCDYEAVQAKRNGIYNENKKDKNGHNSRTSTSSACRNYDTIA